MKAKVLALTIGLLGVLGCHRAFYAEFDAARGGSLRCDAAHPLCGAWEGTCTAGCGWPKVHVKLILSDRPWQPVRGENSHLQELTPIGPGDYAAWVLNNGYEDRFVLHWMEKRDGVTVLQTALSLGPYPPELDVGWLRLDALDACATGHTLILACPLGGKHVKYIETLKRVTRSAPPVLPGTP